MYVYIYDEPTNELDYEPTNEFVHELSSRAFGCSSSARLLKRA